MRRIGFGLMTLGGLVCVGFVIYPGPTRPLAWLLWSAIGAVILGSILIIALRSAGGSASGGDRVMPAVERQHASASMTALFGVILLVGGAAVLLSELLNAHRRSSTEIPLIALSAAAVIGGTVCLVSFVRRRRDHQ